MRYVLGIALIVGGLATRITAAQNQPLRFEVASVKRSPPSEPGGTATLGLCHGVDSQLSPFPPNFPLPFPAQGHCLIKSLSLQGIISVAYPAPAAALTVNDRITGGPSWISEDRYDIDGKAEDAASATDAQLKGMLRELLADRFKLHFHTVQKEVKGYLLVVCPS